LCCLFEQSEPEGSSSSFFSQSYEEATAPLQEEQQDDVDEDSELSLHFHLDEVKSGLSEVKEKMEEIRMGEVRPRGSRGSGGSCESHVPRRHVSRRLFRV